MLLLNLLAWIWKIICFRSKAARMRCKVNWYLHKLGSTNYMDNSILRSAFVHCMYLLVWIFFVTHSWSRHSLTWVFHHLCFPIMSRSAMRLIRSCNPCNWDPYKHLLLG
jgi:hypothetical protein